MHDHASCASRFGGAARTSCLWQVCPGRFYRAAMDSMLEAINAGASGDELAALPLPESFRAALVRRDEAGMFEGLDSPEKDPRKSLHVEDVALPELAPDEAYVAVMASSINFNTVWT